MIYGLAEAGRLREARERLAEQRSALHGTHIRCFDPMFLSIEATIALRENDSAAVRALVQPMFKLTREKEHGGYLNWLQPWLPRLAAIALDDGVESDFVRELIRLAHWEPPSQSMDRWPWTWQIVTFGRFEICRDGKPIEYGRKAPKKPLALLRALIAASEGGASESALADALWADEEADAADRALAAAIHRLRALLGSTETVQVSSNRVKLNAKRVWVDAWAFDALTVEADAVDNEHRDALLSRALALYRGAFLLEDSDSTWALSTRERLRAKFVRHAGQIASKLEASGRHEQAADLYRRALDVDDLAESFYQGLLRCCAKLGNTAEGAGVYQRLRHTLSMTLGTKPSRETEALYQSLSVGR
jgi:LuxR family maltose regulon positive regulatory protein